MDTEVLEERDLLEFARQIAAGMVQRTNSSSDVIVFVLRYAVMLWRQHVYLFAKCIHGNETDIARLATLQHM